MNAVQYVTQAAKIAKGKLTVYLAAISTTVAMLPELISTYWHQLEEAIPHLSVYHGVVTATGLILTIWARVRKEIIPPA